MNLSLFFGSFLRQCAHAGAWLLGLLCISERLAPGSVLPYLSLYLWAVAVFVVSLFVPRPERGSRLRAIALVPAAFLLLAFLFLVTADLGRWGWLLTASAALLAVAVFWSLLHPVNE